MCFIQIINLIRVRLIFTSIFMCEVEPKNTQKGTRGGNQLSEPQVWKTTQINKAT